MSLPIISEQSKDKATPTTSKQYNITKENAAAMGRKGGSVASPRQRIHAQLVNRKWCESKCPLYPCKWSPLSHAQYGGKCALKELPFETQETTVNLFLGGLEGLQKEAIKSLAEIAVRASTSSNPGDHRALLKDIQRVKETFHGKKLTIDGKVQQENVLTIDMVTDALIHAVQSGAAENGPQQQQLPAADTTVASEQEPQDPVGQPANAQDKEE